MRRRKIAVIREAGRVGCPLHGEAGACPGGCTMGEPIPPAPAPRGFVLSGGQWVRDERNDR